MIGITLKKILDECGMNVSELSRRTGVPSQTLYSVIRRDSMKINFDILLRICEEMEVPIEIFCAGGGPSLPDMEEWKIVQRYRRLDDHGRRLVGLVIDAELERTSECPGA
jgi:DNA-binding Xre family transcriptional regulator